MRTVRLSFVFLYIAVIVVFTFQNCAKINFDHQGREDQESTNGPSATPENILALDSGPTNGEGYDGKVTKYIHFSEPGECNSDVSVIQDEIESHNDQLFFKIFENCKAIPAYEIDPEKITLTDQELLYGGDSFFVDYPQSCLEIYNNGGDNPNGMYLIQSSDTENPELQYCNMDFVALGWGPWGSWSECDSACGVGEQKPELVLANQETALAQTPRRESAL